MQGKFKTLISLAIAVGAIHAAMAQDYPNRPIKFVVADSPGTNSDTLARIIGPEMAKALGQPIVVENRPGASYRIGWEYAAKQPADGYTITLVNIPGIVSLPLVSKEFRLDPLKDLPPIMGLFEGRLTISASAAAPFNSMAELAATAKAFPGKLNYGTSGVISRLPMEAVKKSYGVDILMVPYKAGNDFLRALVGGEVQIGAIGENSALSFGDRVKVLAISGNKRVPQWPKAPTFAEAGVSNLVGNYFTLNAPAGLPKNISDKLYAAGVRALEQPEAKAALEKLKFELVPTSTEATVKTYLEQARLYVDLAKAAGIQPE